MAYAYVSSLKQTMERLLKPSHTWIHLTTPEIIESAYREILSVQQALEILFTICSFSYETSRGSEIVKVLDIIHSLGADQFLPGYDQLIHYPYTDLESLHEFLGSLKYSGLDGPLIREAIDKLEDVLKELTGWEKVGEGINSFTQTVIKIKEDRQADDGNDAAVSPTTINRKFDRFHDRIVDLMCHLFFEFEKFKWTVQRLDRRRSSSSAARLIALDGQIREVVCQLEDVLENHVLQLLLFQSRKGDCSTTVFLDLEGVKNYIHSFIESVKKMKEEYINELLNPSPEGEDHGVVSSRIDFGGKKSKMVGLSDAFCEIKSLLLDEENNYLDVIPLVGMGGIGKTTLAKELFEERLVLNHFHLCVWVTVGPKSLLEDILQNVIAQLNDTDKTLEGGDDKQLCSYVHKSLQGKRYLIVFDDVWDTKMCDDLLIFLPEEKLSGGGSRILLTMRIEEVAMYAGISIIPNIRFLNRDESWSLLREKVFGKEPCPSQLEKVGKKIANKCEGLPLTIVLVADILCKAPKTPEYWEKVAAEHNSVFNEAYAQVVEVLYPSYEYLPQHLKLYLLYMGVFPQNCEISCSKLMKLWISEGFPYPNRTCLEKLVSNNVVMVRQQSFNEGTKICKVHSAFWHLCIKEARNNKFFHVINNYRDGLSESMRSHHRLCVYKNVLFGIKDVYKSMASISNARSLLCTGPYHQYPVPVCSSLRLLRILNALTIRFYEFPMDLLNLIELRYLSLTYDGEFPPSISKLWNIECLIVGRHLSVIRSSKSRPYLPQEIWNMQELKHLHIWGNDLPDPCGALLPNLLTLLGVSARSCTKKVFEGVPNLRKIGIQIELAPDAVEPSRFLNHVSHFSKLESLTCVVLNPVLCFKVVAPFAPLSAFPSCLQKLTLSGFGYGWEDIRPIASLQSLVVLKLRCYAFRGLKWEIGDKEFPSLEYLLIEDSDMVHWTVGNCSLSHLRCLRFTNCYKLQEFPRELSEYLHMIEFIDCNLSAVTCAKQFHGDLVHSSSNDKSIETE